MYVVRFWSYIVNVVLFFFFRLTNLDSRRRLCALHSEKCPGSKSSDIENRSPQRNVFVQDRREWNLQLFRKFTWVRRLCDADDDNHYLSSCVDLHWSTSVFIYRISCKSGRIFSYSILICLCVCAVGTSGKSRMDLFWTVCLAGCEILFRIWEYCWENCHETVLSKYSQGEIVEELFYRDRSSGIC